MPPDNYKSENPIGGGAFANAPQHVRLHKSTFEYLKPSDEQLRTMSMARRASANYADALGALLPDGPDKTYVLRKVRDVAMWANIAITRHADGSPRE